MNRHYFLILLVAMFAVSSCSYKQLALNANNENYVVYYDDSIPDSLKRTIAITFDNSKVEDKNKTHIYLKNFNSSIYNIYAGSSLRSIEGEISAVIQLEIVNEIKTKNKNIKIMKRHNSGELNPFAEKETIKTLQKIIDNEIYNQILLEVGLFEM